MSAAASSAAQLPQLEQIRREIEESSDHARKLVSGMRDEQLLRRPAPDR